jgi:hypothetical protein
MMEYITLYFMKRAKRRRPKALAGAFYTLCRGSEVYPIDMTPDSKGQVKVSDLPPCPERCSDDIFTVKLEDLEQRKQKIWN